MFARSFWGVESPRVALLSVGAEVGKGNRQVRETTDLFAKSGLNFIGNIEANEVPRGGADVVVCDGFVGNIVMKLTEGLGQQIERYLRASLSGRLADEDLNEVLVEIYEMNNVVETRGGGPLLGVNGVSVVGHGAARSDAVTRAIGTAKLAIETGFVPQMNRQLEELDARLNT